MMWTLSVLILAFVGGSLSNECDLKKCNADIFGSYPGTAEELLEMCRNIEAFGNCELDLVEKCKDLPGPVRDDQDIIRNVVNYLNSECQEDKPTFQVISRNLQCMRRTFGMSERTCSRLIRGEKANAMQSQFFADYESQRSACLWSILEIKCNAIILGQRCGDDLADAVEDVMTHIGGNGMSACTPEILEEIEPLFEIFEAIVLEELEVEEEIDKRK
nr:venom protein [Lampona murina]